MCLNKHFSTYILWITVLILSGVIFMKKSKINWTELARIAPENPATGKDYRGQSLKRVAEGLRQNVRLYNWLQGNGIRCAKTKEGKYRSGKRPKKCNVKKQKISNELATINKAIAGNLYN